MARSAYHRQYKRMLDTYANKYYNIVLSALNAQGTNPDEINSAKLSEAITELYQDACIVNARKIYNQLRKDQKKSDNLRIWRETVNRYLMTGGLNIQGMEETTRKRLLQVIADGQAQGFGASRLASYVSEQMGIINQVRAELIVRTELTTAFNMGAFMGVNSNGVVVTKEWISTNDNRTRRIPRDRYDHLHMNGITTQYDGWFIIPSTKSIDAMQFPGDPSASAGNLCNCRCTVAFVPVRDAQGKLVPLRAQPPQMGLAANIFNIMSSITNLISLVND